MKKKPHFYKDFDYPLATVEEVDNLSLPDPRDPARYKGFGEDAAWFAAQGYLTGANLNGFFSGPHYFCIDYQEFLISMLMDPDNTKKLIDTIGAWNLAAAEEVLKRGAECIVLCDDLGSADNLLISPELYRDWIFPWHRELCDLAHRHDACVHLHSHGDIRKILPLVLETGVDMLDPFDLHESMDLVAFLEEHPGCHTVPVGGLSKKFFQWDRATRTEYLESLFTRASKAGRWMFMDPSGIPETLERDTYLYFLDTLRRLSGR